MAPSRNAIAIVRIIAMTRVNQGDHPRFMVNIAVV
jgi:hypothetical protein